MAQQNRIHKKFAELFGADLRSLAALRIGVAGLILFDLVQRSTDLAVHYTDFGMVSRSFAIEHGFSRWFVSIHFLSGVWQIQAILFSIAGVFALALLVGYKTRVVTVVSWILLTSLITRNEYIIAGGDIMLRALLFWGMFLPWGACYSIDRAWNPSWGAVPRQYLSCGTIAYVVQIFFIYWFTVLHKSGAPWRVEGTAIYYALSLDYLATNLGHFLVQFPLLLKIMTHVVFSFELIGPILLISPFYTEKIRTAGIIGFCLLHLGISATLRVGLFPAIGIISMLFFLPSEVWEKLFARLRKTEKPTLTLYHDPECNLCWRIARVIKTFFLLPETRVSPAQADAATNYDPTHHKSLIVVDDRRVQQSGFDALAVIAGASPILGPLASLLKLSFARRVGEKIYSGVAGHRKISRGAKNANSLIPVPAFKLLPLTNFAIILLLLYLLMWNVATLPNSGVRISERSRFLAELLRMDQGWKMFTPYPPMEHGWYVIPGMLSNGQTVDLFRGGEALDWRKPRLASAMYKNHRWVKYMEALQGIKPLASAYAEFLCRSWSRSHKQKPQLEQLEIFFIRERILLTYGYVTPEKISLLKHQCPLQ